MVASIDAPLESIMVNLSVLILSTSLNSFLSLGFITTLYPLFMSLVTNFICSYLSIMSFDFRLPSKCESTASYYIRDVLDARAAIGSYVSCLDVPAASPGSVVMVV